MERWNCFSCFQAAILDDLGYVQRSREEVEVLLTLWSVC